jgi:putative membrane-bound dehydrogenase-like protein
MIRLALTGLLLVLVAAGTSADRAPAAKVRQVRLNGHNFTLPAGFEIELAAGPPLVDRPISADFDEQGRLYVSDSSGSNEKVADQLKKKPHRILRLEDTKGDGLFDRRTVFADKMMFPEGTMWHAGSLYVAAPPSIWKLTDTNGDGVAEQRVEWFKGKTLTGCANDLHGPYLGPDGWIYWCKGAFAQQTYDRPGRKPLVTRAAHIFRCRPDGTGVEPVMTGGMDNPVDVVFTPGGERIFTTTFLQFPGGGRRDGLIHAVYGGVYGKDWDVLSNHPWTGPAVMPVLTHLGPAAPCGLTRYESKVFGPKYQHNLFACLFNLQKVTRHVLTLSGATFTSRDEDFLVSDNKDFHPTDVIEDADGSLLVIDTGGWYKLCCPTSQLVKPDVLGAIYRIRRAGAPRIEDPRGLKLAWGKMRPRELADLLDDPRPAVRKRAVEALAARGAEGVLPALTMLRTGRNAEARRNAVWALTRIDTPQARTAVHAGLADLEETVRQTAIHSISVWRDPGATPALVDFLKSPNLHTRRVAAEALGRIGDRSAVPALLAALGQPADRFLEHSLTYALIEIADREGAVAGLTHKNSGIRRGALVALDQMDGGKLEASAVTTELTSSDPKLKETAWWIAGRHPEWGEALGGFLRQRLAAKNLTEAEQEELIGHLAKLARGPAVQALLAERLEDTSATTAARRVILRAMARAGLKEAPAAWLPGLTQALAGHRDLQREAVATARALRLPMKGSEKLAAALWRIGTDDNIPADVRLGALAAVPGGLGAFKGGPFSFLQAQLAGNLPALNRTLAAEVLAKAKLNTAQLHLLTDALKTTGPLELDKLLEAYARSADAEVGTRLIRALMDSPGRAALHVETLKPRLAKYPPEVQKLAEELYASLNVGAAAQRAKLESLVPVLKGGDVRRGQAVFNSAKTSCVSCHAIGYLGGNIGPDLTRIGSIRTERDLLEAIVFPSASFVRGYEPVLVTTRDGTAHNGVLRKETIDELVLATGPGQEVRIARKDVEDMQPSRVSVMPAGLDQLLTPRELADLVAFLKACR